jgi:hypothetical protein
MKGVKGSGKSKAFEMIGVILFGKDFRLKPKPANETDLQDNAIAQYIYVIDNFDGKAAHLLDILAAIATRMGICKRKLYTDNEMIHLDPKAFMMITSRTPYFNRDDISDRMLLFRVDRIKKFTSGSNIIRNILKHRDLIWRVILDRLCLIVAKLERTMDQDLASTKFRIADFANLLFRFAMRFDDIDSETGWDPNEVYNILEKMVGLQSKFTLEDNSVFLALEEKLNECPDGFEMNTTDLFKEMKEIAEEQGLSFPSNARSYGTQLKQIIPDLSRYWNGMWEIEERRGNYNKKIIKIRGSRTDG